MLTPSQELPPHPYDPVDFASMLACFDCAIAMRMHVVILCALSGVPSTVIVRESKVTQILDDLEINTFEPIDSVTSDQLVTGVLTSLADRENLRRQLLRRVEILRLRCCTVFADNMTWDHTAPPNLILRLRSQLRLAFDLLRSVGRRLTGVMRANPQ